MNPAELLELIGEVNEDYVLAADQPNRRARPRWVGLAACAVCAALALTGVLLLKQPAPVGPAPQPLPTVQEPAPNPSDDIPRLYPPEESAVSASPGPALVIDLNRLAVNELSEDVPQATLRADFHLTHQEVEWGEDEIAAWFGKTDFTPAFIPGGLIPAQGNNSATVFTKDGQVDIDLLRLGFYVDYYEDGGPRSTDECVYARGFSLTVSKHSTHPFRDWLVWEPTVVTSDIAGTDVTVTHTSYSYGPYDPDTHAPSGYYDWYSAEFTLDGLNYEITAQRLTLEEVAAVAASVITEGTDFTVISVEAAAPDPPEASPTPAQEP